MDDNTAIVTAVVVFLVAGLLAVLAGIAAVNAGSGAREQTKQITACHLLAPENQQACVRSIEAGGSGS